MAADVSGLIEKINEWALAIGDRAVDTLVEKKIGDCPVASGDMRDSINSDGASGGDGTILATIQVEADYASYTDEGTEAHDIFGNPWIAFEGDDGTVIRNTDQSGPIKWVPGAGVAQNIGWFSATLQDDWTAAVQEAADSVEV